MLRRYIHSTPEWSIFKLDFSKGRWVSLPETSLQNTIIFICGKTALMFDGNIQDDLRVFYPDSDGSEFIFECYSFREMKQVALLDKYSSIRVQHYCTHSGFIRPP